MKTFLNLSILLSMSLLYSCSVPRDINKQSKKNVHPSATSKYNGHSGRYENCSICQRIIMNQETALVRLKNDRIDVEIEGYENILECYKKYFLGKSHFPGESKVIPDKIRPIHVDDSLFVPEVEIFDVVNTVKTNNPIASNEDPQRRTEGIGSGAFFLGLLGLIIGIAGITTPLLFLGLAMCIAALVMGIVSINKINRKPNIYRGKGLAITGIIFGGLGTLVLLVFIPFLLIALTI